jgi:hypothetical protein
VTLGGLGEKAAFPKLAHDISRAERLAGHRPKTPEIPDRNAKRQMLMHRPLALNRGQQHFATVQKGSPNPTLSGKSLGLGNQLTSYLQRDYSKSVGFGQCCLRRQRKRTPWQPVNGVLLTRGKFVLAKRQTDIWLTGRGIGKRCMVNQERTSTHITSQSSVQIRSPRTART